jgi:hypothetical protein
MLLAVFSSAASAQLAEGSYEVTADDSGYSGDGVITEDGKEGIMNTANWSQDMMYWDPYFARYEIFDHGDRVGYLEWNFGAWRIVDDNFNFITYQTWTLK